MMVLTILRIIASGAGIALVMCQFLYYDASQNNEKKYNRKILIKANKDGTVQN